MQFCLKILIEKKPTLGIIKKGNLPAFEQPSIGKKPQTCKVQHQFIARPTQAAVPGVTKDVTIAVFSFVTFLECFLCLELERLNCTLRQYSNPFIQSVANSLGLRQLSSWCYLYINLKHLEKTYCMNFIEKQR